MSETARHMLVRGIAAARAGENAEAQRYLERVLHNDATRDQRVQAHLCLSRIATSPADQREHLEEVLAADPIHAEARRALAILDGRLNPEDIIDPDNVPQRVGTAEEAPSRPAQAQRLICPMCAGRVRFEPGKPWVECQYCGHRQPALTALQRHNQLEEQDFVVALATARGHTLPAGTRAFHCQGCQATLLTTGALSTHCPYCGSAHIVEHDAPATISPDGVVPFVVDEAGATAAFRSWLDHQLRRSAELARTTRPRGLYLPIWTFDLMGEIGWRGYESEGNADANGLALSLATGRIRINDESSGQLVSGRRVYEGTHYVMLDDVVVPATHTLPYAVSEVFRSFDLELAVLYDPVFLSDWPAELYEVAVSDASLVARRRALNGAYESVRIQAARSAGGSLQNLQAFSRSLAVQAYKLVLVPVWLANYRHDTATYTVAVNGQNSRAFGQSPNRGLGGMIRDWLST